MKKFTPKKCLTPYCRGTTTKSGRSPHCSRCRNRRWAEKYPANYAYKNLRTRAGQRGHSFTLSRERFLELWNEGLAKNHGRGCGFLSIDRIENDRGYSDDNVRILSYQENSRKQFVPFFARQIQNINHQPDDREIKQAEAAMAAFMKETNEM